MSAVIESGVQLLARLTDNSRKSLEGLEDRLFPEGLQIKQTVEITGEPGSGKTLLLTQLIASCILPPEYKGFNINVLFINADHHFQVTKLAQIMQSNIKKSSSNPEGLDESKIGQVIEMSLKNLLIINCTNNYQFVNIFDSLSNILETNSKIGIVAVDGISAFYLQYREMCEEIPKSMSEYVSKVLKTIHASVFLFNVKTIFTKHSEYENKSSKSQCVAQPVLGKVNHRINLSKEMNLTRGLCKVETGNSCRSFEYETTELGLNWLDDKDIFN